MDMELISFRDSFNNFGAFWKLLFYFFDIETEATANWKAAIRSEMLQYTYIHTYS